MKKQITHFVSQDNGKINVGFALRTKTESKTFETMVDPTDKSNEVIIDEAYTSLKSNIESWESSKSSEKEYSYGYTDYADDIIVGKFWNITTKKIENLVSKGE